MTSQGGPYSRFRRALDSGNLLLVRAAAVELPNVPLDDALRICLLLRGAEPDSYERAALRWLGRFALESWAPIESRGMVRRSRGRPLLAFVGITSADRVPRP